MNGWKIPAYREKFTPQQLHIFENDRKSNEELRKKAEKEREEKNKSKE